MSAIIDVAIVGAGPYGLSLAAHLREAGLDYRQFGIPMRLWQTAMPKGMFLKSQGFASNLSDPRERHTLEAFCQLKGLPYASYGLPVPLDTFVSYGQWFLSELGLSIEEILVTDIAQRDGLFTLTLSNFEQVQARRVVVAAGVEHFPYLPAELSALPSSVCTHSSAHTDLARFSGRDVIVVGAGQSALESAALLHENGAAVRLVARKQALAWNGEPLALDRPLLQRLKEPEAGLGSGWNTWFYSNHPDIFRHLPQGTRIRRARTALGPAGASWLRNRVEGQFPVLTGHAVAWAVPQYGRVRLGITTATGASQDLTADHVVACTGYRPDVARMAFLGEEMRSRLRTVAGTPAVDSGYQSSVTGLYFIGPAVAPTFGPVMRFVFGSRHAATAVSGRLAGTTAGRARPAVAAGR